MNLELNNIFSKYFIAFDGEDNSNTEICKKCGGDCCNRMGCHISPFDLKEISFDFIRALIDESNCISIDWWEGDAWEGNYERVYYLRLRNEDSEIVDPSWHGKCSILTDVGCSLSFQYRPKGGRGLIPSEEDCCIVYSKYQCCEDWYPYYDILEELHDYYDK